MPAPTTERDQLARDLFLAGSPLRVSPGEAFDAADAFMRELQGLALAGAHPGSSLARAIAALPVPKEDDRG